MAKVAVVPMWYSDDGKHLWVYNTFENKKQEFSVSKHKFAGYKFGIVGNYARKAFGNLIVISNVGYEGDTTDVLTVIGQSMSGIVVINKQGIKSIKTFEEAQALLNANRLNGLITLRNFEIYCKKEHSNFFLNMPMWVQKMVDGVEDEQSESNDKPDSLEANNSVKTVEPVKTGNSSIEEPVENSRKNSVEQCDKIEEAISTVDEPVGVVAEISEDKVTTSEDSDESSTLEQDTNETEQTSDEIDYSDESSVGLVTSMAKSFAEMTLDEQKEYEKALVEKEMQKKAGEVTQFSDDFIEVTPENREEYVKYYEFMLRQSNVGNIFEIPKCILSEFKCDTIRILSTNIYADKSVRLVRLKLGSATIKGVMLTADESKYCSLQVMWTSHYGGVSDEEMAAEYIAWRQSRKFLDFRK